jgi:hypothetical protein
MTLGYSGDDLVRVTDPAGRPLTRSSMGYVIGTGATNEIEWATSHPDAADLSLIRPRGDLKPDGRRPGALLDHVEVVRAR